MPHPRQTSLHDAACPSRKDSVPHSVIPPVPPPPWPMSPNVPNAPGVPNPPDAPRYPDITDAADAPGSHGPQRRLVPARQAAPAATPPPAPAGLPSATLAARQCYLRHTAPVPGSRSGFRQLGPVRMLVCFWQDRMSLLQIHSDARRAGHGSQAMALLVGIAERHGLHIVANALPLAHGNDCLDQRTLTAWYLGFGFRRIPDSAMNGIIYSPTSLSRSAGTA